MRDYWTRLQHFGVCCFILYFFPAIPFVVERFYTHRLSPETLCVGSGVYVFSLGASSRYILFVVAYMGLAFVYCVLLATMQVEGPASGIAVRLIAWSLAAAGFVSVVERVIRHLFWKEPFADWVKA